MAPVVGLFRLRQARRMARAVVPLRCLLLCTLPALSTGPAQAQPPAAPLPPPAPAQAATQPLPLITWTVLDAPPANILNNGAVPASAAELGTGIMDRMLQELIARLPQYRHEFRLANLQRVWASMRQGDNLCSPNMLKTPEREQWAWFTPAMLMPPVALVLRAADKQQLTQGAPAVSLRDLLHKDLKGALEPSRSYGAALDPLLQRPGQPALPGGPSPSTSSAPVLDLVALGRYDYTLEYPMTVHYLQLNRALPAPLAVVPLREAQAWSVGHVACTRNAWGKAVQRDIDEALHAAFRSPAYRDILAAWLPPAYFKAHQPRIHAFYDGRWTDTPVARAPGRTGELPSP